MKKTLFFIASLMLIIVGKSQAADNWNAFQYEAASVSTVSFSSAPQQAFLGEGIILAVGSSSSSVNSYWDIYESTLVTSGNVATDPSGKFGHKNRINNYQLQYSTSNIASGELPLYPQRVQGGCYWLFSDQTANIAWIKYIKLNK